MTIERLREAYEAQPFSPFTLHLADGRAIRVISREYIAFSPTGRTIIIVKPDEGWNVIDLLLVTDLEFVAPGKKRRNGR